MKKVGIFQNVTHAFVLVIVIYNYCVASWVSPKIINDIVSLFSRPFIELRRRFLKKFQYFNAGPAPVISAIRV